MKFKHNDFAYLDMDKNTRKMARVLGNSGKDYVIEFIDGEYTKGKYLSYQEVEHFDNWAVPIPDCDSFDWKPMEVWVHLNESGRPYTVELDKDFTKALPGTTALKFRRVYE